MFTKIVERFFSRIALETTNTSGNKEGYLLPTPGVMGITLRCLIKKGAANDIPITLKTSTSEAGANQADYPVTVPIYVNGIRQTAAKTITIGSAVSNTGIVVDFCLDPATMPADSYIGLYVASSNASNLVTVEMIEDVAYKPTQGAALA